MTRELKPIKTRADYKAALAQVSDLWGAKDGTPRGDRLDVLATLIDAYEAEHFPIDPPPIQSKRSSFAWNSRGPRSGGDDRHAHQDRRGAQP